MSLVATGDASIPDHDGHSFVQLQIIWKKSSRRTAGPREWKRHEGTYNRHFKYLKVLLVIMSTWQDGQVSTDIEGRHVMTCIIREAYLLAKMDAEVFEHNDMACLTCI